MPNMLEIMHGNMACANIESAQNGTKSCLTYVLGHIVVSMFGRVVVVGTSTFARPVPNVIAG